MVVLGYTNLPICILSQLINGTFLISSIFNPMKLYLTKQRVFLVIRTILSFSWSQWSILRIEFIIILVTVILVKVSKGSGAEMCPTIVSRIQIQIVMVIYILWKKTVTPKLTVWLHNLRPKHFQFWAVFIYVFFNWNSLVVDWDSLFLS